MLLYANGDNQAFEEIYRRYQSRVFNYLNKRLPTKTNEEISDIFQNIFTKFHKARKKYDPKYPLLKWIYTISRNELLDHLKKKCIESVEFNDELLFESTNNPEDHKSSFDITNESSLSSKEKLALNLRYINEAEFSEISNILNTSQANSRKIISRALKKLKDKYQTPKRSPNE